MTLLGCLALLGQLLLPTLHAQSWARQNADPLLYAICGRINPALLSQLRSVTPPEVLQKLQQDHAANPAPACDLCLSVHGHVLGSSGVASPASTFTVAVAPLVADTAAPITRHLRRPPSRGPPSASPSIS